MKSILGIGGSPRKGGNSDILLDRILNGAAQEGILTELVQLRDFSFQGCIGCEKCRKNQECTGLRDGMQLIYPKIKGADGIVLISPIYSYNVTGLMKSFIDRLYCFYDFADNRPGPWSSRLSGKGRKAVIAAIGEQSTVEASGMDSTLETMRRSIQALGYEVIDELPVLGIFHKGKIKEYADVLEQCEVSGRKLASSLI